MPLLSPQEAAERTKLAHATLAKLRVVGGGPPFIKLGSRVVYEAADVDAWIAARGKQHSTRAPATCGVLTTSTPNAAA